MPACTARARQTVEEPMLKDVVEGNLARLYFMFDDALERLTLTEAEARYVRGLLRHVELRVDAGNPERGIAMVQAVVEEDLAAWHVTDSPGRNGHTLFRRLKAVGYIGDLAIQDALEQVGDEEDDEEVLSERFRQVGLGRG